MQTPEEFRRLADLLRDGELAPQPPGGEMGEEVAGESDAFEAETTAARDVRLFRARVEEAIESAVVALRCDIAAEIIGRELQLAPASIGEIVQRALRRFAGERPVRVRVHPEDAGSLGVHEVETVADSRLRRGDAVLECGDGTIDISLGVRLDAVLRAYR